MFNLVARLIGRVGCRIKRIQEITGTGILIFETDKLDKKQVKIVGTNDAQILARNMIEEAVGKELQSEVHVSPMPPEKRINKRRQRQRPSSPIDEMSTDVKTKEQINSNEDMLDRTVMKKEIKNYRFMPPIKKDFYIEHIEVNSMSVEDVKIFRFAKNNIMVEYVKENAKLQSIPKPIRTFMHAFQPYPEIMNIIIKHSFIKPSPVQCQAWPIIMGGYDLIAVSQTGTGKKLTYILPAFIHLLRQSTHRKYRSGPTVIILGPTKDTVFEIEEEIKKFIFAGIKVMSVYDNVNIQTEIDHIKEEKPDIIVAMPGRLKDLIFVSAIKMYYASYLVFDAVDRILDMGYKTHIETILKSMRHDKQTIFTSTTWPIDILQFANYCNDKLFQVIISSYDLTSMNLVKQKVKVIKEYEKRSWLENFIKKNMSNNNKIIIFMCKKNNRLFKILEDENIDYRYIYGRSVQKTQETSLTNMREGVVSILIATDVVSWEIDIQDTSLVINYDFPLTTEEYINRLGMIGKEGKPGSLISLFTEKDRINASSLINVLGKSKQPVPEELLSLTFNNLHI